MDRGRSLKSCGRVEGLAFERRGNLRTCIFMYVKYEVVENEGVR